MPLPDRPRLDDLLGRRASSWAGTPTLNGLGGYVTRFRDTVSVSSRQRVARRGSRPAPAATPAGRSRPRWPTPVSSRRSSARSLKEGSFYALLVRPSTTSRPAGSCARRFPLELVDFEEADHRRPAAGRRQGGREVGRRSSRTDAMPGNGGLGQVHAAGEAGHAAGRGAARRGTTRPCC